MPGQHLPADHSRGDANTIGGYAAVHGRPAAFEGSDGLSYSVEIATTPTGDGERPWGAYLLFVQWGRIGATSPDRWHSWQRFCMIRLTCLVNVIVPFSFGLIARAIRQPGAST